MARGSSGARGVFFVKDPDGSQRLSGAVRGDWWIHYYCKSDACPQGRRHREKVGSRALASEVYGRRKARVRVEGWCPRVERRERARQQLSLNDLIVWWRMTTSTMGAGPCHVSLNTVCTS
jgi:hypothetical protein